MPIRFSEHRPPPASADLSSQSPEDLALAAQRGSRACFTELVNRFHARLFSFLVSRGSSPDDAAELTQDAFLRAWERIESYDPAWRFSTWLFTIGSRMAVSRHRRGKKLLGGDAIEDMRSPEAPDNSHEKTIGSRLWALAASCLNEEQHRVLWLRYVEDLSMAELARVLGKSEVGARVALFRARQALLTHARKSGFITDTEHSLEVQSRGDSVRTSDANLARSALRGTP